MWKKALQEAETISLSDTNVNFNSLHLRPDQMDHQDRKQIPLMKILQSDIFNEGAAYIPTRSTRYNHQSKKYDFLDHLITNHPENITSHYIQSNGASDHDLCVYTLKTTTKPNHPKYIITRDLKQIDWEYFNSQLSQDHRLTEAALSDDPDQISISIQQALIDQLDLAPPTKKIQIQKKTKKHLQPMKLDRLSHKETTNLLKLRLLTTQNIGDNSDNSGTEYTLS